MKVNHTYAEELAVGLQGGLGYWHFQWSQMFID